MKTIKMILGMPALLAVATVFAVTPAQAQIVVNVDIRNNGTTDYSGTAAAPDTGTIWNGFNVTTAINQTVQTISSLETSTGGSTIDTFSMTTNHNNGQNNSFSPQGSAQVGHTATATTLLNNYVYDNTQVAGVGDATMTFGGLTAGAQFSLYLYSQDAGQSDGLTKFTVTDPTLGTLSATATNTGHNTGGNLTLLAGNNYVEFADLTANSSGNITVSVTEIGTSGTAFFDGAQLVALVPEPSTTAMLGIGGLVLLVVVSRRKRMTM